MRIPNEHLPLLKSDPFRIKCLSVYGIKKHLFTDLSHLTMSRLEANFHGLAATPKYGHGFFMLWL